MSPLAKLIAMVMDFKRTLIKVKIPKVMKNRICGGVDQLF